MIRLELIGEPVKVTDEWDDSLSLDPRDISKSNGGVPFGTITTADDRDVWLTKEMAITLRDALTLLIWNLDERRL